MKKISKYEWFNPNRKKRDSSSLTASFFLYFAGIAAFVLSVGYIYIGDYTQAAILGFGGIWLTIMFAVFTNLRESNWLADKLDRMYYRTPAAFQRDMQRRMRK